MSEAKTELVSVEYAQAFIRDALQAYVHDPADTDFQRGYLACLYVVGREALGMEFEEDGPPTLAPMRARPTVVK